MTGRNDDGYSVQRTCHLRFAGLDFWTEWAMAGYPECELCEICRLRCFEALKSPVNAKYIRSDPGVCHHCKSCVWIDYSKDIVDE